MKRLGSKLVFISVLVVLYLLRLYSAVQSQIQIPTGARVKIIARISQQPVLNDANQIIRLGSFLVKTSRFPDYYYGQQLEVIGKPSRRLINRFQTDFILDYPAIRVLENDRSLINQTKISQTLSNIRGRLTNVFFNYLPSLPASLIGGVVLGNLGDPNQLLENFLQNMRKTGTIHIIVASGYNLSVIAGLLMSILIYFIKRKPAALMALIIVWFYALMAGAGAPIIRAAIMASLTFLAQISGREKDSLLGLVLAAALMLIISPLILFDIGFQLSFLATAGILLIGLNATLAAQIATLPILLANFGEINLLSPLINAVILPVIPLIMILGLLAFLVPYLAWLAWLPLVYVINIINLFGSRSWGWIWVGKIPFWLAVGYYGILGIWIFKKSKIRSTKY